ncbi:MAG: glycosyltransferase family 4 protein [Lachnospiraceae bacterium]|nr:glycosyltransferase family 4 protein [Lachnospiraceae bacterium]
MKVCMIVPNAAVKGGIASVVNGYRGSVLERKYHISYVESYQDGSKWQKLCRALSGYCTFIGQLLRNRPDVVHIHSSFGPSFYRKMPFIYLSCLFGIPVINHIHGAEFDRFYEKASERKKKTVARVYGRCTKLIVLSEEWKARIGAFVPKERIEVLENYCKIPDESYARGRKEEQVLFMGELGARKGCYDIPAIWAQVLKEVPSAQLVMAGDGEMEAVKEAFAKQELRSGIVFPGWVRHEEKEKLFRESAVFLLPTYNEGMPVVVLEAMGYGLGIVTTNVGGIPKLIQNGINGCIEKPGDIQSMAWDVVRLLREPELCRVYGGKARAFAARDYSLEGHLKRLGAIYESAAGSSRTRGNERRHGHKDGAVRASARKRS